MIYRAVAKASSPSVVDTEGGRQREAKESWRMTAEEVSEANEGGWKPRRRLTMRGGIPRTPLSRRWRLVVASVGNNTQGSRQEDQCLISGKEVLDAPYYICNKFSIKTQHFETETRIVSKPL